MSTTIPHESDPSAPEVARVYLGESVSLATLAPVLNELRIVFRQSGPVVEIDSRDLVVMTEAASMLLAREMDRAVEAGVRFQMTA